MPVKFMVNSDNEDPIKTVNWFLDNSRTV